MHETSDNNEELQVFFVKDGMVTNGQLSACSVENVAISKFLLESV